MVEFESQCRSCRHYRSEPGYTHCAAFPDGIPLEILFNKHDHRQEFPGDGGVRWRVNPRAFIEDGTRNPFVETERSRIIDGTPIWQRGNEKRWQESAPEDLPTEGARYTPATGHDYRGAPKVLDWQEAFGTTWMSPDDYLKEVTHGFGMSQADVEDSAFSSERQKLVERMRAGLPIDPAWIEWDVDTGKMRGQEGRNRAIAARSLGIKYMPVVVAYTDLDGDVVDPATYRPPPREEMLEQVAEKWKKLTTDPEVVERLVDFYRRHRDDVSTSNWPYEEHEELEALLPGWDSIRAWNEMRDGVTWLWRKARYYLLEKAPPPGMRPARPGEKPDWIGPRGGGYVRVSARGTPNDPDSGRSAAGEPKRPKKPRVADEAKEWYYQRDGTEFRQPDDKPKATGEVWGYADDEVRGDKQQAPRPPQEWQLSRSFADKENAQRYTTKDGWSLNLLLRELAKDPNFDPKTIPDDVITQDMARLEATNRNYLLGIDESIERLYREAPEYPSSVTMWRGLSIEQSALDSYLERVRTAKDAGTSVRYSFPQSFTFRPSMALVGEGIELRKHSTRPPGLGFREESIIPTDRVPVWLEVRTKKAAPIDVWSVNNQSEETVLPKSVKYRVVDILPEAEYDVDPKYSSMIGPQKRIKRLTIQLEVVDETEDEGILLRGRERSSTPTFFWGRIGHDLHGRTNEETSPFLKAPWREADHPRDEAGRFTEIGGTGTSSRSIRGRVSLPQDHGRVSLPQDHGQEPAKEPWDFESPRSEHDLPAYVERLKRHPKIQAQEADYLRAVQGDDSTTHWADESGENWHPERVALHGQIRTEMLNPKAAVRPGGARPRALIMIGPPASGKTTARRAWMRRLGGEWSQIDADYVKERLPEFRERGAAYLHEESKMVAKNALAQAVAERHDVAYDTLGGDPKKLVALVKDFVSKGYDVEVVKVELAAHLRAGRAVNRLREENRWVPIEVLLGKDEAIERSWAAVRGAGLAGWARVDSGVPRGEDPRVVEQDERFKRFEPEWGSE